MLAVRPEATTTRYPRFTADKGGACVGRAAGVQHRGNGVRAGRRQRWSPATGPGAVRLTGQDTGSVSRGLPFQVTSNLEIWSRATGTTMSSLYASADSTGQDPIQCAAPPPLGTYRRL